MELFKSRTRVAYTNAVGDKVYPVIVDIKKGIKSTEDIQFVSSDVNTGILSVAFISGNENFNVSGADVVCSVMRPDASTLELPCEVVRENIVEVPLGINGTSQDGVYSFDFKVLKGGNKVVGTPIMNYSVSLSIGNDNAVLEDDRLPVLTMLMTQVNELSNTTRETINQANTATEATREATAKAIEATNTANETINKVTQDTANAIAEVNATSDTMVENVNNAISSMDTTVNNKISEVNIAKNDMINDVSSTKANMVNEVTNAKNEMTNTVTNKVNEVEGRFNALTASQQQSSEVIDARDGETSLKARLDRDIEKAKQVYVNVEGSHISTDSSVGYLKDVEILGNTIQDASNLADIRSVGDKVEGQELYEIPVVSCGKNVCKDRFLEDMKHASNRYLQNNGGYTTPSGIIYLNKGSYIMTIENTDMKHINSDANIYIWKKDKTFSSCRTSKISSSFTINDDEIGITFYVSTPSSSVLNDYVGRKIQIEEGTVATPYEPYQEDKLTILSPTPLEKVGDVADRLICKDGVWGVEKNVKTVVLNGSEKWHKQTNSNNIDVTAFSTADLLSTPSSRDNLNIISNLFQSVLNYGKNIEGTFVSSKGNVWVSVLNTKLDTLDENGLYKYLSNNNLIVKLITQPQFIPLPHDQQIKLRTFANKTNISFGCEIEGTIKAQVPKSLGATVNTHTEQINNLNKELDRVKKLEESTVSTVETESDFTTVEATNGGYFEDVKLEGKTVVNKFIFSHGELVDNTRYNVIAKDYRSVTNIKVTIINPSIKPIWVGTYNSSSDVFVKNYKIEGNSSLLLDLTNVYLYNVIGYITDGWTSIDELKQHALWVEGDHTQNPPSYFEGLKSVGQSASEDGVDEIVVSSVKGDGNLFDGKLDKVTVLTDGNNMGLLVNHNDGNSHYTSHIKPIPVHPNTKYEVGINDSNVQALCMMYDRNMNPLGFEFSSSGVKQFTTLPNTRFVRVRYQVRYSQYKNYNMYLVKVNGNNKVYQSDKKRLLYYNDETQAWEKPTLRQWDSIEKHSDGKYYYHQRSGEVVLNGSEDWDKSDSGYQSETTGNVTFHSPFVSISSWANSSYLICDAIPSRVGSEGVWGAVAEGITTDSSKIMISILKSKLSTQDAQGFKQWLQTNPTTVVYQLAEEKVYECTNIDLITYANETNYIVNCGAIAPKSILKVHNNISNVVKILQEKVSLLENKFIEGLKKVLAGDMYSLAELLYPEDFVEENPENSIMLLPFE